MQVSQAPHTPNSVTPDHGCFLFEGSAQLVLLAARDLIHAGWRLLHHPLYGNYRPHQQPYRSILLQRGPLASPAGEQGRSAKSVQSSGAGDGGCCDDSVKRVVADPESLHYIEEALEVFRSSRILTPDMARPAYLKDCAVIDFELMRLPLRQAGLPDYLIERSA